ncbi:UNVERIFIED_ORG: hypothetical protein ABIB21_003848 [Arthrobacter sp. UYEF13]
MNNENTANNQSAAGSAGAIGGSSGGALPPEDEDDVIRWVRENLPDGIRRDFPPNKNAVNDKHVEELYDVLTKNRVSSRKYGENGLNFEESTMPNGTKITLRSGSGSGGKTIDIVESIGPWKIHIPKVK